MGIKVKAIERNVAFEKGKQKWAFVMQAELYSQLNATKVIEEAAVRSGLPKAVINAGWSAIGEVIAAWATEGHQRIHVGCAVEEALEAVDEELLVEHLRGVPDQVVGHSTVLVGQRVTDFLQPRDHNESSLFPLSLKKRESAMMVVASNIEESAQATPSFPRTTSW